MVTKQSKYRFFENGWPVEHGFNGLAVIFNTDFRIWLKYEMLAADKRLTDLERNAAIIKLCCKNYAALINDTDIVGRTAQDIMGSISWFYSCGDSERLDHIKITDVMQRVINNNNKKADISIYWDFLHVWAAFKLAHNIDLYTTNMHWWKFKALLHNLPGNNSLAGLQKLRSITRDEFMGKSKPKNETAWGEIVLQQKLKAIPELDNEQS